MHTEPQNVWSRGGSQQPCPQATVAHNWPSSLTYASKSSKRLHHLNPVRSERAGSATRRAFGTYITTFRPPHIRSQKKNGLKRAVAPSAPVPSAGGLVPPRGLTSRSHHDVAQARALRRYTKKTSSARVQFMLKILGRIRVNQKQHRPHTWSSSAPVSR